MDLRRKVLQKTYIHHCVCIYIFCCTDEQTPPRAAAAAAATGAVALDLDTPPQNPLLVKSASKTPLKRFPPRDEPLDYSTGMFPTGRDPPGDVTGAGPQYMCFFTVHRHKKFRKHLNYDVTPDAAGPAPPPTPAPPLPLLPTLLAATSGTPPVLTASLITVTGASAAVAAVTAETNTTNATYTICSVGKCVPETD